MEAENIALKVNTELAKQMDKSKKIDQEVKMNFRGIGFKL